MRELRARTRDLTAAPAPEPTRSEQLLVEMLGCLQRIETLLREQRRPRATAPAADLLLAIGAVVETRAFNSKEVITHAVVDPVLRAALDDAGVRNARQLGKRLKRVEGRAIGDVLLERIGQDRDGLVWRVWRVSEADTHQPHLRHDGQGI